MSINSNRHLITITLLLDCECDVWYHRFVVQNSLLFTLCAQLYLFIDGVSVFLNQEMGVSDSSVSLGMIIFLGVLTVAWFPIESFNIRSYTMYTFTAYVVTIFYLSSIMSVVWALEDKCMAGFVIFFLVMACILFVARITLTSYRSAKRASYENITYNVHADQVNV